MKPFFVYLLKCSDGSYYCGQTDDMEARLAQHAAGGESYTATRKPLELVWQGEFETRAGAIEFEQKIKGWSRAKKEALIAGDWDRIRALAKSKNALPSVRAEPVEAWIDSAPRSIDETLRQAQGEREGGEVASGQVPENAPPPVPAEPVEALVDSGPRPIDESLRQAQGERQDGEVASGQVTANAPAPVRAEPVEAWVDSAPRSIDETLRQAQGERQDGEVASGQVAANAPAPVRAEPVEAVSLRLQRLILDSPGTAQRRAIAKAITLIESTRADHRLQADELLTALLPHTEKSFRLGISGVPGVGKSTFIEVLGLHLIAQGHRVAVLTIDPSSTVSGGSILGDKTRMERLSVHEKAYIRPSPSSGTLGGVAEKTREAMLVCEAAGYDVVIVETVGVGQSETAVANMTDMLVLMQLPNAGDDLQAIKKGVMEIADLVLINKADIDKDAATRAEAQITSAMRLFGLVNNAMRNDGHDVIEGAGLARWSPQVLQLSALHGRGVDTFWNAVADYRRLQTANGRLAARRQQQALAWMWERIEGGLRQAFRQNEAVRTALPAQIEAVVAGRAVPSAAARQLLQLLFDGGRSSPS